MTENEHRKGLLEEDGESGYHSRYGSIFAREGEQMTSKLLQSAFLIVVLLMILVTFVLSIVRTVTVPEAKGLYLVLGLSLLGFVVIALLMVLFIRNGTLSADKQWFIYIVGCGIILESIFTNILLFQ